PASYAWREGYFDLNGDLVIVADPEFLAEANYLQNELSLALGRKPSISSSPKEGQLQVKISLKEGMGPEAYQLVVSEHLVHMEASTSVGAFYGVQSLKSMIGPKAWAGDKAARKLQAVEISDAPRFGHRAFM